MTATLDFVVIAEFEVRPGAMDAFLDIARDDACHSVADEVGCRQFDVILSQAEENVVAFYEVYESRASFDAHLLMPHLQRFRSAFPSLIAEERPVRFFSRHHPVPEGVG